MAATFTLNFFRSGIQFGSWGSFQLPGLLNFGEFKVCCMSFPLPISGPCSAQIHTVSCRILQKGKSSSSRNMVLFCG